MSGSILTCADVHEKAPELALGILSGGERAEVVLHLQGCARCQAYVAELTEAADVLPQLVPEHEPPVGFESRVMRRIGEGKRRARRRLVASIAAVAAAAAIVSITVVRVVESNGSTQTALPATTQAGAAPVSVLMEGGTTAAPAGWAYVTDQHGVAISVDYGIPAGQYAISVQAPQGGVTSIGNVDIHDGGRGSWTGRSGVALRPGSRIALVDAGGNEVCHGTVPIAE
jgi:hypothetical protein